MTKKHFIALADAIRCANEFTPEGNPRAFSEYAKEMLAEFCLKQNRNFNRQRWLDYIEGRCGPNGGKR